MNEIVYGVISAAVYAGIRTLVLLFVRRYRQRPEPEARPGASSKKIRVQFLVSLILLVVLLPVGVAPPGGSYGLRVVAFIASGIAFVAAWGSFDLALELDPEEDRPADHGPQRPADDGTQAVGEENH